MATKWKDLQHKSSPEVRVRLKNEAHAELQRLGLGKLRQARQQTQMALAERLDVPQGAISRMERRSDLLIGTMRHYIEALGGRLELRAIFDDGAFEIDTLTTEKPRQRKTGATGSSAAVVR